MIRILAFISAKTTTKILYWWWSLEAVRFRLRLEVFESFQLPSSSFSPALQSRLRVLSHAPELLLAIFLALDVIVLDSMSDRESR